MDADSGGVVPMVDPPYAVSHAAAPFAKLMQLIPTGTAHVWRSWLKAVAEKNMEAMVVTAAVSQVPMSWSKAVAE